jgi:hypothetical protein
MTGRRLSGLRSALDVEIVTLKIGELGTDLRIVLAVVEVQVVRATGYRSLREDRTWQRPGG